MTRGLILAPAGAFLFCGWQMPAWQNDGSFLRWAVVTNLRMASVADLNSFDEIIDARSPAEFLEDHIPGAINLPVLDNDERAEVGTLYKQVSSFAAKKVGAPLVWRNIARHLEAHFKDKPKNWHPLIYCWRGGSRSGSLVYVLQQIGFNAQQLEGGYKAYRRVVLSELALLPQRYSFHVISGPTGSGKTRLLQSLARLGGQVLDLEKLAAHRGSLLGAWPDQAQPNQKSFESAIWHALRSFDPARVVFVESESKRIGVLCVPEALIYRMRASPCIQLDVAQNLRVDLLLEEYAHFFVQPDLLRHQLECLVPLRGRDTVAAWHALIDAQDWRGLFDDLLSKHYDPAYARSLSTNYAASEHGPDYFVRDISYAGFEALATQILNEHDVVLPITAPLPV